MREIKFRAKSIDGYWVSGDLHLQCKYPHIHTKERRSVPIDPKTIGQFTGLHDKNGKEIYEGDIIMINLTDGSTAKSSVVWNNRRGYWGCDIDINHGVQLGLIDKVRIEVVGNIHDNPELIEKGGEQ